MNELPPFPLFEDDLNAQAVIEPAEVFARTDMPARVVLCFFAEVLDGLAAREGVLTKHSVEWAHGIHRVYEFEHRGQLIAAVHPGVGAPLAVGIVEELIAKGGRQFVAVGGAGALLPDLVMGHAMVVDSAIRDEGTSFHYLRASRVVDGDAECVAALRATLEAVAMPVVSGRVWTTDAAYRETRDRVSRRVAEGCIAVDMEASALIAVARFRGVRMANLLYAGDSLAGQEWEHRDWQRAAAVRERLFWLAADAVLGMPAAELA